MVDQSYCAANVTINEYFERLSDNVELRLIEFQPENGASEIPLVVFVAGWVSMISGWKDVIKRLTSSCRVLYVETREKRSAVLPPIKSLEFSIERMSLDVMEIINKRVPQGSPFYLAGSSLGSTVILDYLSRNARQPDKAILIAPICDFPFPLWLLFIIRFIPAGFYSLVRPVLKWYLRNIRLDKKNEPEQIKKYEGTIDAAEPARLKANAFAIKDYSVWDKLPKIKAPVIIVGAQTDKLHGLDVMEKMVAMMSCARFDLMKSNKETHSEKAGDLILSHIKNT